MPTKPEHVTATDTAGSPVVDITDLSVHFNLQGGALSRLLGLRSRSVKAVDGVNLTLHRGEVLGLVGESGSGKTTLGRALLGMVPATDGSITYHDRERGARRVSAMRGRELRELRTDLQMVFQDPHAALNPSMTVEAAVGDPLVIHGIAKGAELRARVAAALERVGLSPAERYLSKYPSDLSGGQKQRAVIARAIILDPEVLVADEPVSMLDMSVRAKILQLMLDLKRDLGLTYVYITHDLASAKYFCDRIAIMYLGRIVEVGARRGDLRQPAPPLHQGAARRRSPSRTRPGRCPGSCPVARSRTPRTRRWAAPSTRGAPRRPPECGWESRDLRAVIEEHWTRRSAEAFEEEQGVLGDLEELDRPALVARLGKGGPARVRAVLDRMRDEDARRAALGRRRGHPRRRRRRTRGVPRGRRPGAAAGRRRGGGVRALPRAGRPGGRGVVLRSRRVD